MVEKEKAGNEELYFSQLSALFNSYRIAQFNRRYYTRILAAARKTNAIFQGVSVITTAGSVCLLAGIALIPASAAASARPLSEQLAIWAGVVSLLSFLLSVGSLVLNLNQRIDDATTRVQAWHFAERLLESALKYVKSEAASMHDAAQQVRFANVAYELAANIPELNAADGKLKDSIAKEVNKAIPPDYVWTAL